MATMTAPSAPPPLHLVLGDEELLVERAVRAVVGAARATDPDVEVRRQATSGLGGFDREDSEELRLALVARLDDTDTETREEAIFALAQLGDDRVDAALRVALDEPETSELIEMAAMAAENRRRPRRPN